MLTITNTYVKFVFFVYNCFQCGTNEKHRCMLDKLKNKFKFKYKTNQQLIQKRKRFKKRLKLLVPKTTDSKDCTPVKFSVQSEK